MRTRAAGRGRALVSKPCSSLQFSGNTSAMFLTRQSSWKWLHLFLLQNIAFLEIVCSIKTDARGYCIFKAVPMNTLTKWKRLVWIFSFVCLYFYFIYFGCFTFLWLNFTFSCQGSHRCKNLQPASPNNNGQKFLWWKSFCSGSWRPGWVQFTGSARLLYNTLEAFIVAK